MTTLRRVRGDAKLEQLDARQKQQLLVWLEDENRTYVQIAALVKAKFGLSVSKSAVGVYWRRHLLPKRLLDEAGVREDFENLPQEKFEESLAKLATLRVTQILDRPRPDLKAAMVLMQIVLSTKRHARAHRRLDLAERRVVLLERREAARAARLPAPVDEPPLTDEERGAMLREHFGLPPLDSPLFPDSSRPIRDDLARKENQEREDREKREREEKADAVTIADLDIDDGPMEPAKPQAAPEPPTAAPKPAEEPPKSKYAGMNGAEYVTAFWNDWYEQDQKRRISEQPTPTPDWPDVSWKVANPMIVGVVDER